MEKNSFKTIIMLIISIFFVVFFQTVVYSAFSSSLNVEGNAYARIATDVRVTDFKISEKYSSSNYVSNYENFSKNTVSTSITFNSSAKVYYAVSVSPSRSAKSSRAFAPGREKEEAFGKTASSSGSSRA